MSNHKKNNGLRIERKSENRVVVKKETRGRKPLYRAEMLEEAYKLGSLGLTGVEVARFWNVNPRTLDRWIANNPEFSARLKRGRAEADMTVIQSVLEQARKGNIAAAIFWLKNRCGWRDVPVFVDQSQHNHYTTIFEVIESAYKHNIPAENTDRTKLLAE